MKYAALPLIIHYLCSDSTSKHHLSTGLRRIKMSLFRPNMSTEAALNDPVFCRKEVSYLCQAVVGVRTGNMPFSLRLYLLASSTDLG